MEPNVPWRRPILERRARAYKTTGNPRAALAGRELARFMEKEPSPFTAGLPAGQ